MTGFYFCDPENNMYYPTCTRIIQINSCSWKKYVAGLSTRLVFGYFWNNITYFGVRINDLYV